MKWIWRAGAVCAGVVVALVLYEPRKGNTETDEYDDSQWPEPKVYSDWGRVYHFDGPDPFRLVHDG